MISSIVPSSCCGKGVVVRFTWVEFALVFSTTISFFRRESVGLEACDAKSPHLFFVFLNDVFECFLEIDAGTVTQGVVLIVLDIVYHARQASERVELVDFR
jgi:hypothetical protein